MLWRALATALILGLVAVTPAQAGSSAPSAAGTAAEREVDLELVLAADVSGSMDMQEAELQRRGFVAAIRHPDVIAAIRAGWHGRIAVTYVEWAGDHYQRTLVDWTEISDARSAAAFADAVDRLPIKTEYWTSISTAIAYGADAFRENGFRGVRRVIDISGDGPNNKGAYVVHARDRAVAKGVVINGLPIVNDRPGPYGMPPLPNLDLYYQDCVIGGSGAFVVIANGFADFARAIRRKLVLEIAGTPPPNRLLQLAADRVHPPCDVGEQQIRRWRFDLD